MKNYIFEIENNTNTNEHQDIVGGPDSEKLQHAIDIIKKTWTSSDDYWILEIKARLKDHLKYQTGMKRLNGWLGVGGNRVGVAYISGNTPEEAIERLKNVNIQLFKWSTKLLKQNGFKFQRNIFPTTDGNMNAVYTLCDLFFARAYFTINKKSYAKTNELFKELTSKRSINQYDPRYLNFAIYSKGCPIYSYIDCDIDPDSESKLRKGVYGRDEIKRLTDFLKSKGISILNIENSHNGVHIYLNASQFNKAFRSQQAANNAFSQFDIITNFGTKKVREFSDNKIGDNSILDKRGSSAMLLYSPCGTNPKQKILINRMPNAENFGKIEKTRRINAYSPEQKKEVDKKMFKINETILKNLVEESINKLLNEINFNIQDKIGTRGPLTSGILIKTQDIFKKTLELIENYKKEKRKISFDEFFNNDDGYNIWKNYVTSMTGVNKNEPILTKTGRKQKDYNGNIMMGPVLRTVKKVKVRDENGNIVLDDNGKPVFEEYPKIAISFFKWVQNMTQTKAIDEFGGLDSEIFAYKDGDSYLFGYYKFGLFIANSFSAPQNGVIQIIKSVCQYNNVIFSVSLDIAQMLRSIGLYTNGKVHTTKFGGRDVKKMTLTTNKKLLGVIEKMENNSNNKDIDKKEFDENFVLNLCKNKDLQEYFLSNPDVLHDLMSDKSIQKYIETKPEMFTKIAMQWLKQNMKL